MPTKTRRRHPHGHLLVVVLVFGSVALVMLGGFVSLGLLERRAAVANVSRAVAFQVAEAGINYYRWHLAHAPTDYKDGTGVAGPYLHDYRDKDGNLIGRFSLTITPPPLGSTLVTVQSTGYAIATPQRTRVIQVRFAIPSFAQYAVVTNGNNRFGSGTVTYGLLHSNGGTHFDGIAHNLVTSAKTSYYDADFDVQATKPGVWTSVSPSSGVFLVGNQYPVPAVDFTGISGTLATIKADAQSAGQYLAPSGVFGYNIVLKTNDTFDLYKVNKLAPTVNGKPSWSISSYVANVAMPCSTSGSVIVTTKVGALGNAYTVTNSSTGSSNTITVKDGGTILETFNNKDNSASRNGSVVVTTLNTSSYVTATNSSCSGSVTTSPKTTAPVVSTYAFPANGIIFVEDDMWVEGALDTARLTIGAAQFPVGTSDRSIIINTNITYAHTDGSEALGLIAQKNVNVGSASQDILTIDAALVAANGRVGRERYQDHRSTITLYGTIASYNRYGFSYTDGTGYTNRNLNYDANLLYSPPPDFPLASSQYRLVNWQEIIP